jgi:hypothetical protein
MLFEKPEVLPLLSCPTCNGGGVRGWGKCTACSGMGRGHYVRGWWLFWYYPLTRYHLTLEKFRRIFNKVRWLTMFIIGLNFFYLGGIYFL